MSHHRKTEKRTHAAAPGKSANEHVDVDVQTQIHMHSKHSLPHRTAAAVGSSQEKTWIWNVSNARFTLSVMETFEHKLTTTEMSRQTGRRGSNLSSYHLISYVSPAGLIVLRGDHGRMHVTTRLWPSTAEGGPLTPAICPPANISWVWGNTLCWTEAGRAAESSDFDWQKWRAKLNFTSF